MTPIFHPSRELLRMQTQARGAQAGVAAAEAFPDASSI